MPDHHTLLQLAKISEALRDALRKAYELARAGESGEPLREALHFARDLLDLANETLAGDPQAGEHARGMLGVRRDSPKPPVNCRRRD